MRLMLIRLEETADEIYFGSKSALEIAKTTFE